MFNLSSFLLGVAVVFIGGSIVTLIGNLTDFGDGEATVLYCNFWWLIFANIFILIKWWWENLRPIWIITEQTMQKLKNINRLEYMKHLFKNVYLVPIYKREARPILGRIFWAIVIVKK